MGNETLSVAATPEQQAQAITAARQDIETALVDLNSALDRYPDAKHQSIQVTVCLAGPAGFVNYVGQRACNLLKHECEPRADRPKAVELPAMSEHRALVIRAARIEIEGALEILENKYLPKTPEAKHHSLRCRLDMESINAAIARHLAEKATD